MNESLTAGLEKLQKRRDAFEEIATELTAGPFSFDIRRLPRPPQPAPKPEGLRDRRKLPPSLSPFEVAHQWSHRRRSWLRQLRGRDLRAVLACTADPQQGPYLARDDEFVSTLAEIARPRQLARALSNLYFQHHPPRDAVVVALVKARRTLDPRRCPAWWSLAQEHTQLERNLGNAVRTEGWSVVARRDGYPESAATGEWAANVIGRVYPASVSEIVRLLQYTDGGVDKAKPAPVGAAQQAFVRSAIRWCGSSPTFRPEVARLLRRRIGDVFGTVDWARWRGLEAERIKVRSWVAGEILDVLFKHLVPPTYDSHQTAPRRRFWKGYTHRVERVWVLVAPGLRHLLGRADVKRMLERVGSIVRIRELKGGPEQAVLWMHLQADSGRTVTVVEGNANASVRVRPGAWNPPKRGRYGNGAVRYSPDVVHGPMADRHPTLVRGHRGSKWQTDLREFLDEHRVFRQR